MEKQLFLSSVFALHMVPNIAFYVVEKCKINGKLTFSVIDNQITRYRGSSAYAVFWDFGKTTT